MNYLFSSKTQESEAGGDNSVLTKKQLLSVYATAGLSGFMGDETYRRTQFGYKEASLPAEKGRRIHQYKTGWYTIVQPRKNPLLHVYGDLPTGKPGLQWISRCPWKDACIGHPGPGPEIPTGCGNTSFHTLPTIKRCLEFLNCVHLVARTHTAADILEFSSARSS